MTVADDVESRIEALEAQVAELKSVQDLLLRMLSTTRPLESFLRFYGATEGAEHALHGLLDELLTATRGPANRHPSCPYFRLRLDEIFPQQRGDQAFVQALVDTLKVDRPAYRELHAYMAAHGWPG
jgi:hypothetical protein